MTTYIQFTLPWPSKVLSPNERLHWTEKQSAKHGARADGFNAAMHWMDAYELTKDEVAGRFNGDLEITYTFFPPDRKRRDMDNLLASMKTTQDGIFQALGIDDSKIVRCILEYGELSRTTPRVVVRIQCLTRTDAPPALLL